MCQRIVTRYREFILATACDAIPYGFARRIPTSRPSACQTSLLHREYQEDVRHYNESLRRNDRAIGIITQSVEPEQLVYFKDKTTAKDVWNAIKAQHANVNTGLIAFYTKLGMLEKKYIDSEDLHAHFNYIILENRKLGIKAFDDEFLAQLLLMSLPRDSVTWESLTVSLLQSVTESSPLKSEEVVKRCMVQYQRLNSPDSNSALAAAARSSSRTFKKDQSKKKSSVKCGYCGYTGHVDEDCRKKKAAEASGSLDTNKGAHKGKPAKANIATATPEPQDAESIALASILAEFPSASTQYHDDGSIHIFLAHDVNFMSHSPISAFLAKTSKDESFIDSGCSRHLSPRREWFRNDNFKRLEKPISIHLGDASVITAEGIGTLQYLMDTPHAVIPGVVPDALYVPALATTLLSVSHFTNHNHDVLFKGDNCYVVAPNSRRVVAHAIKTSGGLYRLLARPVVSKEYANLAHSSTKIDINILHRRLGHLGHDNVKRLVDKGMIHGVLSVDGRIDLCEACIHGKQHRHPFPPSNKKARRKLDLVHSDVCGPLPYSIGGMRYFITFTDDHTRHVWVYPLRHKSDALAAFKEFKVMVENLTGLTIKVIRTDNGGEYTSIEFEGYLRNHGIIHEKTAPYTPEQNGLAEVMNRIIIERARSMLHDSNISKGFWVQAVIMAAYLINRSPASRLPDKTPHEAWTSEKPSISYYRPFGCPAYAHIPKEKRTKLDSKTRKCIMMGYEPGTKAYRLWDPKCKCMFTSRDVIFDERPNPPSIPEPKVDLSEIIWNGENAINETGITQGEMHGITMIFLLRRTL